MSINGVQEIIFNSIPKGSNLTVAFLIIIFYLKRQGRNKNNYLIIQGKD